MLIEAVATAASLIGGSLLWKQRVRRQVLERGMESHHHLCVVITGSSRGLGLAMAKEFLARGDSVVVSGRNAATLSAAREILLPLATASGQTVVSCVCDVSKAEDCETLARTASKELGKIDVWINNAGMTQHPKAPLASTPPTTIYEVLSTNLLGAIFGCRAAITAMGDQARGGTIFTMDGAGSRGNGTPNSLAYGASKAALPQLAKTLATETKGSMVRTSSHTVDALLSLHYSVVLTSWRVHVCVLQVRTHLASPGMVTTDLLMREAKPSALKIFNILAETPETVAGWLVPRMRAAHLSERPSGEYLKYLTPPSVVWRFATAPWRRDRLVKVPVS